MEIISIEGNIGSGKSLFLAYIKTHYNTNVIFLREPVSDWMEIKDENGDSILKNFYGNPSKYAFEFQILAFQTRIQIMMDAIEANPDAVIVTERSVYTDKYIFAKMMYDDKNISQMQYQIYENMYNYYVKKCKPTVILYVETEPEICAKRVIKRNRDGETIPLEYLKRCDDYHRKTMLIENDVVYVIDGNLEISDELQDHWDNVLSNIFQ